MPKKVPHVCPKGAPKQGFEINRLVFLKEILA